MKTQFLKTILTLATMVSLSHTAQADLSSGMQYMNPDNFTFSMSAVNEALTDCTNLNKILARYSANECGTANAGFQCSGIGYELKTEATVDINNGDSGSVYQKLYLVNSLQTVKHPSSYSKRFDVIYADTYSFPLSEMANTTLFTLNGNLSSAELTAENKLNLPTSYTMVTQNGERYIQLNSKLLTCALEANRISISGTANVSVIGYHPMGNVIYDIVQSTYEKAKTLSTDETKTSAEKNYLLGLNAGETFKRLNYILTDPVELDSVALSLRNVLIDPSQAEFSPRPVQDDHNAAVALLDPGYVQTNAPVQINFVGVSP